MLSFKGVQFPKTVILHAVFFYVRYGVFYRDLGELLAERDVKVDHATLNRWVVKYASALSVIAQRCKIRTARCRWSRLLNLSFGFIKNYKQVEVQTKMGAARSRAR